MCRVISIMLSWTITTRQAMFSPSKSYVVFCIGGQSVHGNEGFLRLLIH